MTLLAEKISLLKWASLTILLVTKPREVRTATPACITRPYSAFHLMLTVSPSRNDPPHHSARGPSDYHICTWSNAPYFKSQGSSVRQNKPIKRFLIFYVCFSEYNSSSLKLIRSSQQCLHLWLINIFNSWCTLLVNITY